MFDWLRVANPTRCWRRMEPQPASKLNMPFSCVWPIGSTILGSRLSHVLSCTQSASGLNLLQVSRLSVRNKNRGLNLCFKWSEWRQKWKHPPTMTATARRRVWHTFIICPSLIWGKERFKIQWQADLLAKEPAVRLHQRDRSSLEADQPTLYKRIVDGVLNNQEIYSIHIEFMTSRLASRPLHGLHESGRCWPGKEAWNQLSLSFNSHCVDQQESMAKYHRAFIEEQPQPL